MMGIEPFQQGYPWTRRHTGQSTAILIEAAHGLTGIAPTVKEARQAHTLGGEHARSFVGKGADPILFENVAMYAALSILTGVPEHEIVTNPEARAVGMVTDIYLATGLYVDEGWHSRDRAYAWSVGVPAWMLRMAVDSIVRSVVWLRSPEGEKDSETDRIARNAGNEFHRILHSTPEGGRDIDLMMMDALHTVGREFDRTPIM